MTPRVSVVIPHYFTVRAPHLLRIAADLRRSSVVPHEVLLWNNEPAKSLPDLSGTGMTVLQADHNYGCQARLLAAKQATGEYLFFTDNDTTVERYTLASLLAHAAQVPDAIVTLEGRACRPAPDSYTRWPKFRGHQLYAPQRVAMSLGRGELVPMPIAQRMLARFPFGPPDLMDDLWWSACAAWEGVDIYVVPCVRGVSSLVNLPEYRTGACTAKNYEVERNAAIAEIRSHEPRIWTDA
jgi:hypothetical protein